MGTAITVNGSLNFPHDFQERDSSVFNNSIKNNFHKGRKTL